MLQVKTRRLRRHLKRSRSSSSQQTKMSLECG